MGNVAVVQVEDGTDNVKLAEEVRGFFFRKSVALDDVIEKVAFFAVRTPSRCTCAFRLRKPRET